MKVIKLDHKFTILFYSSIKILDFFFDDLAPYLYYTNSRFQFQLFLRSDIGYLLEIYI